MIDYDNRFEYSPISHERYYKKFKVRFSEKSYKKACEALRLYQVPDEQRARYKYGNFRINFGNLCVLIAPFVLAFAVWSTGFKFTHGDDALFSVLGCLAFMYATPRLPEKVGDFGTLLGNLVVMSIPLYILSLANHRKCGEWIPGDTSVLFRWGIYAVLAFLFALNCTKYCRGVYTRDHDFLLDITKRQAKMIFLRDFVNAYPERKYKWDNRYWSVELESQAKRKDEKDKEWSLKKSTDPEMVKFREKFNL